MSALTFRHLKGKATWKAETPNTTYHVTHLSHSGEWWISANDIRIATRFDPFTKEEAFVIAQDWAHICHLDWDQED